MRRFSLTGHPELHGEYVLYDEMRAEQEKWYLALKGLVDNARRRNDPMTASEVRADELLYSYEHQIDSEPIKMELRQQMEEAKNDATRYRWLRGNAKEIVFPEGRFVYSPIDDYGSELDAAIDAALEVR